MLLQRGISVKENVIEYIANRIERSYESINYWIKRIDDKLINEKSKVSLKAIKDIFR
jgi:chromosomal replication initiation ATPase DnaA